MAISVLLLFSSIPMWAHPYELLLSDTARFKWQGSGWRVTILDPTDTRFKQLQNGDVIRLINGQIAAKLSAPALNAAIGKADWSRVGVVVNRNGKKRFLTLQWAIGYAAAPPRPRAGARVSSQEHTQDFILPGPDGKVIHLAAVNRMSWVLLNFSAGWSTRSRLELPDLRQIAHDHADNVIVLEMNVGEKEDSVQYFCKQIPFSSTRLYSFSKDDKLLQAYGALSAYGGAHIPITVLIRPGGEIVYMRDGASDKHPFLTEEIDEALQH